jgi:hypothetical protein
VLNGKGEGGQLEGLLTDGQSANIELHCFLLEEQLSRAGVLYLPAGARYSSWYCKIDLRQAPGVAPTPTIAGGRLVVVQRPGGFILPP